MNKRLLFLALLLLGFFYPMLSKPTYSGELTSTYLRLDRQKASTSTGGLLCATTPASDNGVENNVQIIFPTAFTVNSTASNWTVSLSDIPQGSSAWPGIATATSISGQTVTFPSSDLSANTTYCFSFSASNTLTNPSTNGSYVATIRTRNSSNTTIDSMDIALVTTNDSITVTATVPANPTDFQAKLDLISQSKNPITEDTTLTYRLTYGSYLTYPSNITVESQWGLGTIQGNSSATEDLLDYVVGSATNAYNSTPPVIDSINRKVTWNLTLPALTTDQTVTFKLITNASYKGSLPVSFTVDGRVLGPGTQTSDSSVTSNYYYSATAPTTPTPTCIPSKCPTPIPSATPTPTPVPPATIIQTIDVRTISSTEATIEVASNNRTTARIFYSKSMSNLNQTLTLPSFAFSHLIQLQDLEAQTRYYFRIELTDEYRRTVRSDLYLIDTATASTPSLAQIDSLFVTSNDVILTDPLRSTGSIPKIVIPQNTPYSLRFAVSNFENVKQVEAITRDNRVLGLASEKTSYPTQSLFVTEISPGQYIGRLNSSPTLGEYQLIIRISDYSGNISEQLAAIVKTVNLLRIVDESSKQSIENAKITLYYYNQRLKTYELLSSDITPVNNPSKTEPDGTAPIVLPEGKYRAEVEALGYATKSVEFEISPDSDTNYPLIELTPLPFSLTTYVKYSASTASDVFALIRDYLHTLRVSVRFFDFMAFMAVTLLVFLTLVATARRMSVPFSALPHFLLYQLVSLFKRSRHNFLIHGNVVMSNSDNVIPGALVYIALASGRVLTHTTTNALGEFMANVKDANNLKIIVSKKGFQSFSANIKPNKANEKQHFELKAIKRPRGVTIETALWYVGFLIGTLFEAILIFTLFIEILFVLEFGILKVLPFILVSALNLLLWTFHVRHTRSI